MQSWPGHWIHDRFDKYVGIGAGGDIRVVSGYDDTFVVAVNERPPTEHAFQNSVNDCQSRVILVRPVDDIMDTPKKFLSLFPKENLQSMSVAAGDPGKGLDTALLDFAEACCTGPRHGIARRRPRSIPATGVFLGRIRY